MKANKFKRSSKKVSVFSIVRNSAVFIFIFAATIVICIYIYQQPIRSVFPMKRAVFIGNRHLTDDELRALSGIHLNESLPMISHKEICQRLLKSPWIRSVSVRKEFPETLSLVIEEAAPFALLHTNGHLFLIDERGTLLEEMKDDSIPFFPIITGDPSQEREGFSEALKLARLMNDKGFSSERDHIEIIARKPHEITVTIDGTVVRMGAGGYEEKLVRLIELEDDIKNMGIAVEYIDLRFENKAIVKPITEMVMK